METQSNDAPRPAFRGLRTAVYHATDLPKASAWYARALDLEPYFEAPYYVGFQVGGAELGLDPDPEGVPAGAGGVIAYWAVDSVEAALTRLVGLGARLRTPAQEVGGGVTVATIWDPFSNILGLIETPTKPD